MRQESIDFRAHRTFANARKFGQPRCRVPARRGIGDAIAEARIARARPLARVSVIAPLPAHEYTAVLHFGEYAYRVALFYELPLV